MDLDATWDIEKYRTKFESEEHWALKKDFMEAHKDRFEEHRLICLAQVFVNIELLRCKYPDEVMKQVNILAKEIGHDYRANQKKLLQRTFVKASDAASAKVKGSKPSYSQATRPPDANATCTCPTAVGRGGFPPPPSFLPIQHRRNAPNWCSKCKATVVPISAPVMPPRLPPVEAQIKKMRVNCQTEWRPDPSDPYRNVVLVHYSYGTFPGCFTLLNNSLGLFKVELVVKFDWNAKGVVMCELSTGKGGPRPCLPLGSGDGTTEKEARNNAATEAVNKLLLRCHTIKILKRSSSNEEISLENTDIKTSSSAGDANKGAGDRLSDDNVGARLLKLMGWAGGGLGKKGDGISEPVNASSAIGRQGLGLHDQSTAVTPEFTRNIRGRLRDFVHSNDQMADIVFSPDLSPDQRKHIHRLAFQIGRNKVKTTSYGKGANRYLVVSRRYDSGGHLLQMILSRGGATDKHELCRPGTLTLEDLMSDSVTL